jgi:hypothetical protein
MGVFGLAVIANPHGLGAVEVVAAGCSEDDCVGAVGEDAPSAAMRLAMDVGLLYAVVAAGLVASSLGAGEGRTADCVLFLLLVGLRDATE